MDALYLIIAFVSAYLIGTILYSRIYISIFRKGNTSFYIPEENKYWTVESFGTSNTARFLGTKNGIAHFVIDFAKPIIFFYALMQPFQNYLIDNHDTLIYLSYFFLIVGNNYPIWWKFKGGDGIAAGVGLVFTVSWFAGLLGFTMWILFATLSKHSGIGSFIGLTTSVVILMFPGLYDTLLVYSYFDFDYWIIVAILSTYFVMLIKQIKANNINETYKFIKSGLKRQ